MFLPSQLFHLAAGADFIEKTLVFNVSAGAVRACSAIDILNDKIVEDTEKFQVILDPPVSPLNLMLGERSEAEVSITDDDSKLCVTVFDTAIKSLACLKKENRLPLYSSSFPGSHGNLRGK